MEPSVSDLGLQYETDVNETIYDTEYLDTVILAASPDSWSFQHFLDRSTHIILQALRLNLPQGPDTFVLTGAAEQAGVTELWQMLGFSPNQHIHRPGSLKAKKWIFSCRTPLIHPYPSLRLAELFHVDRTVPLSERKVVLYNSRSQGSSLNGGRQVLNEEAFVEQLQVLLNARGEGEELVMADPSRFATKQEVRFVLSINL